MRCRGLCLLLLITLGCLHTPFKQGKRLYQIHCSNCHMDEGQGLAMLYPPLQGTGLLARASQLPCIIQYGMNDTITINGASFDTPMKGVGDLTHAEIANICNYILHQWYEGKASLTETMVRTAVPAVPGSAPGGSALTTKSPSGRALRQSSIQTPTRMPELPPPSV